MPVNARFFLDNKEVIGLWMIYAIVMWLAVCVLDLIFDCLKNKRNQKKQLKINKANHKQKIMKDIEKIQHQNWLYEFNKSFDEIVNFEI